MSSSCICYIVYQDTLLSHRNILNKTKKMLSRYSISPLQLSHAIEGLQNFQQHMFKGVSPNRFLWQKISSPQFEKTTLLGRFCKFWILHSYYMRDTKTKTPLKEHRSRLKPVTNWVSTHKGHLPLINKSIPVFLQFLTSTRKYTSRA